MGGQGTQAHKALGKEHPGRRGLWGSGAGTDYGPGCSPVADPACVAARALARDVVAGVPVATRRAAVAAALAVEARGARLVAFGAVPAGLAGHTAALRHCARLLALTLTASREGRGEARRGPDPPTPRLLWRPALLPPRSRPGPAPTCGDTRGRRSRRGTSPGSTCRGSPARRRTCRPPGGSGRGSTDSSVRSARRTFAPGTGSGRSAARRATCCRRTGCCSCGPTSPRGTGTRPSAGRSATWRCSSRRWSTARPTSRARSGTRRSAGGTRRAGTGTRARSALPSAARDTCTGRSRPRTARAGGRYTAPCSRVPRTGAGTLQGMSGHSGRPGSLEGAWAHPEPARVPTDSPPWLRGTGSPAGSGSRVRPRPLTDHAHPCRVQPRCPALTGVAVGTEVAMAAAALARPHAHLVLRTRGVAFAHGCGQEGT